MGGQSVKLENLQCERARSWPPLFAHVAVVSGDGTAEGGLGEVLHSVRKLGGQALTAD